MGGAHPGPSFRCIDTLADPAQSFQAIQNN
jgi:hypothetical protein